jgi:AcrR family transcriptional regulator
MTLSRRERLFEATQDEIKRIAREHMAAEGTAALSLRAIARAMGMTAPALYRYYADRDALITALIVAAYEALATAMQAAGDRPPTNAYADRLYAMLLCYRDWALAHPTEFQLIFGNPIQGYHAPNEQTLPAARRTGLAVMAVLHAAHQAGVLQLPPHHLDVAPLADAPVLALVAHVEPAARHGLVYAYLTSWTMIHGLVMLELFQHTTALLPDPGAFYRYEALTFLERLGLTPSHNDG